jgi:WD40 repeat protein
MTSDKNTVATPPFVNQPYVGPQPFTRDQRAIFFGREDESEEIAYRIIANPVVLLYAQSGAGKTSLLNAGVFPLLEKEGCEVLPPARMHQFTSPAQARAAKNLFVLHALMSWEPEVDPMQLADRTLPEYLNPAGNPHRVDTDGVHAPRVLIFDQFEELFTSSLELWTHRHGFFEQLGEALVRDRLLRVVFSIREEYVASLEPHLAQLPEPVRIRRRLELLRSDAAKAAIVEPLNRIALGKAFAAGAADMLVEKLLEVQIPSDGGKTRPVPGEFVEPVQLQVTCQMLWKNLPPNAAEIEKRHVEKFGDVDLALQSFYEDAIRATRVTAANKGIKEGKLRRWFSERLITPAGTRGLVYRGTDETEGIPNAVIQELEDQHHLLRGESRREAHWYELSHDRFIKPILDSNKKWNEGTAARVRVRALEQTAKEREKSRQLLTESELRDAEALLEDKQAAEVDFDESLVFALVTNSRQALERRQAQHRRVIKWWCLIIVASLVATGLAIGAWIYQQQQELARQNETAARQSVESGWSRCIVNPDEDPFGSLLDFEYGLEREWNVANRKKMHLLRLGAVLRGLPKLVQLLPSNEAILHAAFSPDSRRIVTCNDRTAVVWDLEGILPTKSLSHKGNVNYACFSNDGDLVISASNDTTARIWDAGKGDCLTLLPHTGPVQRGCFSPDGALVATASAGIATVWEVEDHGAKATIKWTKTHDGPITQISFSPNGQWVLTASADSTAKVWDSKTGELIATLKHDAKVNSAAFGPDSGDWVITASEDLTARVWDLRNIERGSAPRSKIVTQAPSKSATTHKVAVTEAYINRGSRWVATASRDAAAKVWYNPFLIPPDHADKNTPCELLHQHWVATIGFSPDGQYIATGSRDQSARVWDAAQGTPITPPLRHNGAVTQVLFSPNGRWLLTIGADDPGRVWEIWPNTSLAKSSFPSPDPTNPYHRITHTSFSADGNLLLLARGRPATGKGPREWECELSVSDVRNRDRPGNPVRVRRLPGVATAGAFAPK